MSLDRKSIDTTLGAVIAGKKNIHLADSGTEKLCAASDGVNGYWILGHRMYSDSFFAWHLTGAGISSTVATNIGPVIGSTDARGNIYGIVGQMKFSPDGKKVATVNYRLSDSTSTLDIFDFNPLTGQLSNHCQTVLRAHVRGQASMGLEFWPDGSKLFITCDAGSVWQVVQFTLGGSCTAITNSIDTIATRNRMTTVLRSIQAGPDGNLYVGVNYRMSQEIKLDRITKPDGPNGKVRYDTCVYSWGNQWDENIADLPSFVAGFRYHSFKLSVPAASASASVQVVPNPTDGIITISATGTEKKLSAIVSNAAGRVLYLAALPAHIDMSAQPAGLYFYRIYGASEMVQAGKFSVLH